MSLPNRAAETMVNSFRSASLYGWTRAMFTRQRRKRTYAVQAPLQIHRRLQNERGEELQRQTLSGRKILTMQSKETEDEEQMISLRIRAADTFFKPYQSILDEPERCLPKNNYEKLALLISISYVLVFTSSVFIFKLLHILFATSFLNMTYLVLNLPLCYIPL